MQIVGRNTKQRLLVSLRYILLSLMALLMIYPLFWMFMSAFKDNSAIYAHPFALPTALKWSNFQIAWEVSNLPHHFFNTFLYTFSTVAVVLLLSSKAAYAIARYSKSRATYLYFSIGIMIPVNAIIIPFILIFRNIGISNTRAGIILAFIVTNLAFSIFILVPFMQSIPKVLEDAAMIDGCSRTRTFYFIILPISMSGLATVATFVTVNCWNDLFLSILMISKNELITLNQVIYNMRARYITDYGLICAAILMLVLPVIILYSIFQKQIVKGMVAGSVKG